MTDRVIVYPAAIPQDTDILNTNRNMMIALGHLAQATFGTGTVFDGLACTQTTSPSNQVSVAPGTVIANEVVDTSSYGSLASNSNPLVKIGVNIAPTLFTIAFPVTSGQSQNYLIEGSFLEADASPVVLPYYNSTNPAMPYSGPSNSGTPQDTVRQQTVALQLKAGTPATTGTQTTPAVDAGWTGLWVVTVANGATTVINADITPYQNGSAFVQAKLPQVRIPLTGPLTLYVNNSTGNDSNSGLSPLTPFKTLQAPINALVNRYDLQGYVPQVIVADGTYTAGATLSLLTGGYAVQFIGNTTTPTNCKVAMAAPGNCFTAINAMQLNVSGFALESTPGSTGAIWTIPGCGLVASTGGTIYFDHIAFGPCTYAHMTTGALGVINLSGQNAPYTVYGNTLYHMVAGSSGGTIVIDSAHVTISNAVTVTYFCWADAAGVIITYTAAYTNPGNVTGQKSSSSAQMADTSRQTPASTHCPAQSLGSTQVDTTPNVQPFRFLLGRGRR